MVKILLAGAENFDAKIAKELEQKYEIIRSPVPVMSEDQLCEKIADADVFIMAGDERITRKVMEIAKKLKIVGYYGVGVDQDFFRDSSIETLTRRGVAIIYTPGSNARAVAELTIALMFDIIKRTTHLNDQLKRGSWLHYTAIELSGKTLGIVGFGNIGRIVAQLLSGFNMKILTYDPYVPPDKIREVGVTPIDLETLLRESDIVTVHSKLTPETRNLIGEKALKTMKKTAYLINAARAFIVDPEALYKTLTERRIRGAAFDGYYIEPAPKPENDPYKLLTLGDDIFLCTPHVAYNTLEANETTSRMLQEGITKLLKGEPYKFVFNPDYIKYKK